MGSLTPQDTRLDDEDEDVLVSPGKHRATPQDKPTRRFTREEAIEVIVTDPHVAEKLGYMPDRDFAGRVIDWVNETIVEPSRALGHMWARVRPEQMDKPEYKGFEAAFGHGERPQVGSAGEAIEMHLLKGNETGIVHDLVGRGEFAHCGGRVLVGSV